ncbi:MAG: tail fiber domain-containing protein, partial [Ignavibacteria bacterium]|nr:tail fiber domain-containing protein [Ignavibacteria bacterium]
HIFQFFKIPKEVKAVVGELNIGSTGVGTQTLGDLKVTRGLGVGSYSAPTTAGNAIFSGSVGIGTTSPSSALDVIGDVEIGGKLAFTANNVFSAATIPLSIYSADATLPYEKIISMRNNNNQVGTGLRRLGISFNLSSESTVGEANKMGALTYESNSAYSNSASLHLWTRGVQRLTIDSTGNVGIGTTNPGTSKLAVSGGTSYTRLANSNYGDTSYVFSGGGDVQSAWGTSAGGYSYIGSISNHGFGVKANNALAMYVSNTGNVGIGTTGPDTNLHVIGALCSESSDTDCATGIATIAAGDLVAGDSTMTFMVDASANALYFQRSTANASGADINVRKSRGTTAAPDTVVTGDDAMYLRAFAYAGTTPAWDEVARITFDTEGTIGDGIAPGALRFYTNNSAGTLTQQITINSSGYVGIGTASPTYKLQVAGTVYASGSSKRYKQNISDLEVNSEKIYGLRPVSFDYKPEYESYGKDLGGGR